MVNFSELVASLEASPNLRGKRVADVPELAKHRLKYRRQCRIQANIAFGLALFNFVLATAAIYSFWWLSALCAGLMVWLMLWAEARARAMTRQLRRSAAEQVARDVCGMRD